LPQIYKAKPGQHKHNIEYYTFYITFNILRGPVAYTRGDVDVRSPLGLFLIVIV
jgi:hypothetical protein